MKKDYESTIALLSSGRRPEDKISLLCAMLLINTATGDFLVCDRRTASKKGWDKVICYDGRLFCHSKGRHYCVTDDGSELESWWVVEFAKSIFGSLRTRFGDSWYINVRNSFEAAVDSDIVLPRLAEESADDNLLKKAKKLIDRYLPCRDQYGWYANTAPWWNWEANAFRRTDVFRFQDMHAPCFIDKYDGVACYQPFSEIRKDGTSCNTFFLERSVALANMVPMLLNRIAELEANNAEADSASE